MKGHVYFAFLTALLISTTEAINGTDNCCPPNHEIWVYEDGTSECYDIENNKTLAFKLACPKTVAIPYDSTFVLKPDRTLKMLFEDNTEAATLEHDMFCFGNMSDIDDPSIITKLVILCTDAEKEEVVSSDVVGYCMAASSVFLALTAFVYLMLSELRDLQGKTIIALCGSLAIANSLMSVLKLMAYMDMVLCATRGFFTYYFIVSSFFWMNAIAIQILRNLRQSSLRNHGWKEFAWYALYAWGTPAIFTIIMIIVNYHPGQHERPGIGLSHCWFLDLRRQWTYMYSVITILITVNVCIFIYASIFLWLHTFKSTHLKALKYKFVMMLRLFIMMGLPWIFEMVSSLAPAHVIWVIIDLANALQGLVIFLLLVVLRRRVIKALHKRNGLCCLTVAAEKYLALGNDDEDDIVTHTLALPMDQKC